MSRQGQYRLVDQLLSLATLLSNKWQTITTPSNNPKIHLMYPNPSLCWNDHWWWTERANDRYKDHLDVQLTKDSLSVCLNLLPLSWLWLKPPHLWVLKNSWISSFRLCFCAWSHGCTHVKSASHRWRHYLDHNLKRRRHIPFCHTG